MFPLSVRVSFLLVGADRMPPSYDAKPPLFEKRTSLMVNFLFGGRGSRGVEGGLEMMDTGPGLLQSRVSLEEISQ